MSMFNHVFNQIDQFMIKKTKKIWHRLIYRVLSEAEREKIIEHNVALVILSQFDEDLDLLKFDRRGIVSCDFEETRYLLETDKKLNKGEEK